MSTDWKPKLAPGAQVAALGLSADERRCVAQLDGENTEEELALLTGLRRVEVRALLERLEQRGALTSVQPERSRGHEGELRPENSVDPSVPQEVPSPSTPLGENGSENRGEPENAADLTLLKRFRELLQPLPVDQRAARAATGYDPDLAALCFDPVPEVIRRLLENERASLDHGRLIATHHRTTTGLEFLLGHGVLMRDAQVQRLLFRNPQLAEGQLRRLTASKRLLELWKLSTSREVTTQTRQATMRLVRQRFTSATAEERVELIFTSEGRALGGLAGLPLDGKATALLCARTYASTLLITNLATWASTPPALISHLLKQPLLIRQPHLRARLQQHPNAPSGAR